jgi:hypothetical protein
MCWFAGTGNHGSLNSAGFLIPESRSSSGVQGKRMNEGDRSGSQSSSNRKRADRDDDDMSDHDDDKRARSPPPASHRHEETKVEANGNPNQLIQILKDNEGKRMNDMSDHDDDDDVLRKTKSDFPSTIKQNPNRTHDQQLSFDDDRDHLDLSSNSVPLAQLLDEGDSSRGRKLLLSFSKYYYLSTSTTIIEIHHGHDKFETQDCMYYVRYRMPLRRGGFGK